MSPATMRVWKWKNVKKKHQGKISLVYIYQSLCAATVLDSDATCDMHETVSINNYLVTLKLLSRISVSEWLNYTTCYPDCLPFSHSEAPNWTIFKNARVLCDTLYLPVHISMPRFARSYDITNEISFQTKRRVCNNSIRVLSKTA